MEFIYIVPKQSITKPATKRKKPVFCKVALGISQNFLSQVFIFAGQMKYGKPSKIRTIPKMHKKNFMVLPAGGILKAHGLFKIMILGRPKEGILQYAFL